MKPCAAARSSVGLLGGDSWSSSAQAVTWCQRLYPHTVHRDRVGVEWVDPA